MQRNASSDKGKFFFYSFVFLLEVFPVEGAGPSIECREHTVHDTTEVRHTVTPVNYLKTTFS